MASCMQIYKKPTPHCPIPRCIPSYFTANTLSHGSSFVPSTSIWYTRVLYYSFSSIQCCWVKEDCKSLNHWCITCCHQTIWPQLQMLGQLPTECVTPGSVFEEVGVDYAGPLYVKHGKNMQNLCQKSICLYVHLTGHQ